MYGDANILADLISRARWAEFRQLCAMLGVRPQLLDISAGVRDLYRVVIRCLRERSHLAGTARGVFNPHLIGDQPIAQGAASVAPTSRHLYDLPVDPLVYIFRYSPRANSTISRAIRAPSRRGAPSL